MSLRQIEGRIRKNSQGYRIPKKRSKTKHLLALLKVEMNDGGVTEETEEKLNRHFASLRKLRAKS